MTSPPVEVRPLRSGEWPRLREIRLEALKNAPESFFTSLSEAESYPDSLWMKRAEENALGVVKVTMIAVAGERTVGLATGLLRREIAPDVVSIVSVYVSPPVRDRGIARALMEGVEAWIVEVGVFVASLWVVDGNEAALRLYESMGYKATTDRKEMPAPSVLCETRLVKELPAAGEASDVGAPQTSM